jgi:hypothetical protein
MRSELPRVDGFRRRRLSPAVHRYSFSPEVYFEVCESAGVWHGAVYLDGQCVLTPTASCFSQLADLCVSKLSAGLWSRAMFVSASDTEAFL